MASSESSRFGQLLAQFRVDAGLTQQQLAERANMSVRGISDLERGARQHPYALTVGLLASALGLSGEDRERLQEAAQRPPKRKRVESAAPDTPTLDSQLPHDVTPLVGRESDVQSLVHLLGERHVRLVTLTGPAGVGKTRLGTATARAVAGNYRDGVVFVPLASLERPDLVLSSIASALGVQEPANGPLRDEVEHYLSQRQTLLILDNFEHVLDAALLIADLLVSISGLTTLVTSREPLHLRGEQEYDVTPLELPDTDMVVSSGTLSLYPASALFLHCLLAVRPHFQASDEEALTIVEICRRLDGLPLAIELAAVHAKHRTPQVLLQRLTHRLDVLAAGARDLPTRQQTMRNALGWSYDLMGPAEQTLFRTLSVLSGGWSLSAAEAVIGNENELEIHAPDVLDTLVDASLLYVTERDCERRYRMLEVVREYGLEQLESHGETELARRRHAEYYLELTESAEPELMGPRQAEWLDHLEVELDNIRAALRWFLNHGASTMVLRVAGALGRFWQIRAHFTEGREWLERGLHDGKAAPLAVQMKALFAAGFLALSQGDHEHAMVLALRHLALSRRSGDPAHVHPALMLVGMAALQSGDTAASITAFREGLSFAEHGGNARDIARSLLNLGLAMHETGDGSQALVLLERALRSFEHIGESSLTVVAAGSLAYAGLLGADQRSDQLVNDYLDRAHQVHSIADIAAGLEGAAVLAVQQHEAERAAKLLGAAHALRRQTASRLVSPRNLQMVCQAKAAAEQLLGMNNWEAAWKEGQDMTETEAVSYGLMDL